MEKATENLNLARIAYADGVYSTAAELAGRAYKSGDLPEDADRAALELYYESIAGLEKPERLLEASESGKVAGRKIETKDVPILWKARALVKLGKAEAAVDLLEKHQENGSSISDVVTELNAELPAVLAAAGRTNEAVAAYSGICGRPGPEFHRTYFDFSGLLISAGKTNEAVAVLEKWIGSSYTGLETSVLSYRDSGRLLLGELQAVSGNTVAAESNLTAVASAAKANPDIRSAAMIRLFFLKSSSGDTSAAEACISNAVFLAGTPSAKTAAVSEQVRFFCRRGEPEKAIDALDASGITAISSSSASSELRMDISAAFLQKGGDTNFALAEAELQKIIESSAGPGLESRAQAARAELLKITGRPEAASIAYMRAAGLSDNLPTKAKMLLLAAESQMDAEQFVQALDTLDKTLLISTNTTEYTVDSGKAAFFKGECLEKTSPADAELFYERVAKDFSGTYYSALSLYRIASLAASRNDFEKAGDYYRQTVNAPAASTGLKSAAVVGRGQMLAKLFRFDEALAEFDRAAAMGGEAGEQAEFLRAAALHNLGMESESLAASLAFLDIHPNSPWAPDVTFWLGRCSYNNQEFEDSERYFTEFVKKWPARPECSAAMLWTARTRFARHDYEGAASAALTLIRTFPSSELVAEARLLHGESLCEQMRFDEAILVFDELCARHPESPWKNEALGRKADSLFTLGTDNPERYAESIAVYKQLLADNRRMPLDSELQTAYKIGRCLEKSGKIDEAESQYYEAVIMRYRRALEERFLPNEKAKAWFSRASLDLASLYEQRNQWRQAMNILRQMADENVPGREEAAERAGKISRNIGN